MVTYGTTILDVPPGTETTIAPGTPASMYTGPAIAACPPDTYLVESGCFVACDPGYMEDPPMPTMPLAPGAGPMPSPWGLDTHVDVDAGLVPAMVPMAATNVLCDWRFLEVLPTVCPGDFPPPMVGVAQAFCAPLPTATP